MRDGVRAQVVNRNTVSLIFATLLIAGVLLPASAQKGPEAPLSERQVTGLVEGGVYSGRIAELVRQRGIGFKPSPRYLQFLREKGARELLIRALAAAKSTGASPSPVQSIRTHSASAHSPHRVEPQRVRLTRCLALGAKFENQKLWPQAEQQYRAASNLAPHNASIFLAMGRVLAADHKPTEAAAQYRNAIRLQPDFPGAHQQLGDLLIQTGDENGAIAQYREALRWNPQDAALRQKLASILYSRGDLDPAVVEYRALQSSKPDDPQVEYRLGLALYAESELSGAVAEFREAIRLQPDFKEAHAALGDALLKQGNRYAALNEYRKAGGAADSTLEETFNWLSRNLAHN